MAVARDSQNAAVLGEFMASSYKAAFAVFLTASTITGPVLSKLDDSSMGTCSKAGLFYCNDLLGRFLHRREISIRTAVTTG